jgi:hypothetical protein
MIGYLNILSADDHRQYAANTRNYIKVRRGLEITK